MSSENAHLSQAMHNEKFALSLKNSHFSCNDWIVTVLFYSALHYVDYQFVKYYSKHPTCHKERTGLINQKFRTKGDIIKNYKHLSSACWMARYLKDEEANSSAECYFDSDQIDDFIRRLNSIKEHLRIA